MFTSNSIFTSFSPTLIVLEIYYILKNKTKQGWTIYPALFLGVNYGDFIDKYSVFSFIHVAVLQSDLT